MTSPLTFGSINTPKAALIAAAVWASCLVARIVALPIAITEDEVVMAITATLPKISEALRFGLLWRTMRLATAIVATGRSTPLLADFDFAVWLLESRSRCGDEPRRRVLVQLGDTGCIPLQMKGAKSTPPGPEFLLPVESHSRMQMPSVQITLPHREKSASELGSAADHGGELERGRRPTDPHPTIQQYPTKPLRYYGPKPSGFSHFEEMTAAQIRITAFSSVTSHPLEA